MFRETDVTVDNVLVLFVAGEVVGYAKVTNLDEVLIEMESVKLSS